MKRKYLNVCTPLHRLCSVKLHAGHVEFAFPSPLYAYMRIYFYGHSLQQGQTHGTQADQKQTTHWALVWVPTDHGTRFCTFMIVHNVGDSFVDFSCDGFDGDAPLCQDTFVEIDGRLTLGGHRDGI